MWSQIPSLGVLDTYLCLKKKRWCVKEYIRSSEFELHNVQSVLEDLDFKDQSFTRPSSLPESNLDVSVSNERHLTASRCSHNMFERFTKRHRIVLVRPEGMDEALSFGLIPTIFVFTSNLSIIIVLLFSSSSCRLFEDASAAAFDFDLIVLYLRLKLFDVDKELGLIPRSSMYFLNTGLNDFLRLLRPVVPTFLVPDLFVMVRNRFLNDAVAVTFFSPLFYVC